MSRLYVFFYLLIPQTIFAQFAIIDDPDGYVNVRATAKKEDNIKGKLNNGDIVYVFDTEGNWTSIDFYTDKKELDGFIYFNRTKFITDYQEIPLKTSDKKSTILESPEIKITLTEKKFNIKDYKVEYLEDSSLIKSLNGKPVFGKDGNLPTTEYASIMIEFGKQKIILPKEALENLFEPNLSYTTAHYDSKNDILYLESLNSDGSGSYNIIWTIKNKKYFSRNIGFGF